MWTVYLLLCDQKIVYTGITNNLNKRLKQHNGKLSTYTKKFSDLKLIYTEDYKTETEAAKREKEIKGWNKNKKLELIK